MSDAIIGVAAEQGEPSRSVARTDAALRPQRILYVVSVFPALSETFIVREIQTLIDNGVDVRIVSLQLPSDGLVQTQAAALLNRVRLPQRLSIAMWNALRAALAHPLPVASAAVLILADGWSTPRALLKSLAALLRGLEHLPWLREFAPEFIYAHWSTYPATAAWVLSRATGRPFGFTCHAYDVFRIHQLLPRKIKEAALAVTISQHNIDWLQNNVSPLAKRKLEIVHCGVDLKQVVWCPDGRTGNRVLGVGRLVPEKGFHTLIEALALLRARGTPFHCTLIGNGPERERLQALIQRHGLDAHVELTGALGQEAVHAALGTATVFALPCQIADNGARDGIPVALMEAMAAGCPVVSCPVSGVPELINDEVHGLLAPERDAAGLAQALIRLLTDEPLRRRLSVAARQRIELEFDASKEALRLHGLMGRAIADAA